MKKRVLHLSLLLISISVVVFLLSSPCFPQEEKRFQIVGEIFGVPVPIGNYYFAKRVVLTFNAKWRPTPKDEEELEDLVWQELILSYEAYRRGIEASSKEIDEHIDKILKAEKVNFDWRKEKEKFEEWTKNKLGVSPQVFRNQIEHLIKLEKLQKQVIESIEPEVTEEEAYQKFLDECNTLSVELVQFDELKEAEKFYKEVSKPQKEGALEKLIWEDLLLSYEAFKRKVEVTKEEIEKNIYRYLREREVRFNWKKDERKFKTWLKGNLGLSQEEFKKFIIHFAKIDKLRQLIYRKEAPPISEERYTYFLREKRDIERAYQRFSKEFGFPQNAVLIFPTFQDAEVFYKRFKREATPWEDRKRKEPDRFKRPGFVALDFLIHMWGFKREDAYRMIERKVGDIYPPAPIYKGYGVFKILRVRKANPSDFNKRRDYYFERIKKIKKYQGFKEWLRDLKEDANIKIYKEKF